jgi:hypothetical protein
MQRVILAALAVPLLAVAGLIGTTFEAFAAEAVGKVSRLRGECMAVRGSARVVLAEGAMIEHLDELETGADARLEVTLLDDTKLTLGEKAKIKVDSFVFDPNAGKGEAVLQVVKGALRFTTGKIGTMADKNVTVKTGFATLAVRGTDFWAGPIDGANGVLLLTGKVEVKTKRGTTLLDDPRDGVMVSSINKRPGKARTWSDQKATRALDQVAF